MSNKNDSLNRLLGSELDKLKMNSKLQKSLIARLHHAKRMIVILSQSCAEIKHAIYLAQSSGDNKNHSFFAKLHNSAIEDLHLYSEAVRDCKQRLKFWDDQITTSKCNISALENSIEE